MPEPTTNPVIEQGSQSAGNPATEAGGAPQGGGATPKVLTDEDVQKLVKENVQKYEDDIRKLKSTFDKREAENRKAQEQREAELVRKLRELEMKGMDETERKKYEATHKEEEFARLATENQLYQQKLGELSQARMYEKFFIENGVPASELVTDQGVEALAESGWRGISNLVKTLKDENSKLKTTKPTTDLPKPPNTLNHSSQNPSKKPSHKELADKYAHGDVDRLYSMIEKGTLPPSILGLRKE